ncbi:hypothetical protein [Sulfurimonas sp. HSL-1716]|uniref:DUF6197 family protein n=1 Tax=Hydrocurvibacter sulfurireducens TaxID=3131937 RepID=UPI0031F8FC57
MKKILLYTLLTLLALGSFIIFGVIGVYKTENGIVLGLPDYEKRDIRVSQVDLDILTKADALLSDENTWQKEHPTNCSHSQKLDLYCALQNASVAVMGKYVHRQPALQEVRFNIDDYYRKRWTKHRLIDFNANKNTTFKDVKSVLAQAIMTVKGKLAAYKKR